MKSEIPEELKRDLPQSAWGKILMATPVVMTVVATMLAGLASSEMTRAQYDRSLAAQQQSKAGDQWSFFQAKRLRGALQRNTLELLQAGGDVRPLEASAVPLLLERLAARLAGLENRGREMLRRVSLSASAKSALERYLEGTGRRQTDAAQLKSEVARLAATESGAEALGILQRGDLPAVPASVEPPEPVRAAMDAVERSAPDVEVRELLGKFDGGTVESALADAREQVRKLDAATGPVNEGIDAWGRLVERRARLLNEWPAAVPMGEDDMLEDRSIERAFATARFHYAASRYDAEARLNQAIANLYELQVRRSNISAERHHARSQRFFFGMLAAQAAVIIATFAIAARQRNLLWSLAAAAGIAAIVLAIYVYVFV